MEKKFKFSDKTAVSKIVYLTVIAILCVSAIVIGIVASNSRKKADGAIPPEDTGSNTDTENPGEDENKPGDSQGGSNDSAGGESKPEVKLTFVSPVVGTVIKSHSATVPVFSVTLDEWRIHTGLDISVEEGAEVMAAADGEVTAVYNDPMLGRTVEITHSDTHKSYYSNLDKDGVTVAVGDKLEVGDVIGCVGDSSISELCDEPHLHFEMKVSGVSVNPLDHITEESKEASLGIVSGE
ncbi:MAG: M23 family metallopeptidase [Clostridia bacterium]|nr:M23 family metallopeptidase [Clostridia bacterium]